MDDYQWIEGAVAVEAALRADSREVTVVYVAHDRYDGPAARIRQMARERGVLLERPPNDLTTGATVVARVGPRRPASLDTLFDPLGAVVVLLDGVEDPYNFGQAVRSLYAAGIDGLIVPPRNWLSAAATVTRASAGATEYMPTAVAATAEATAHARARVVPVAVAVAEDARPMDEVELTGPLLLIIGGEKRGVSRATRRAADLRVAIPYGRDFPQALGTAGAAAVLAFEVLRQRRIAQQEETDRS
jgi:23S rRNA (guanosine2251-2'-O)-methyltransferase